MRLEYSGDEENFVPKAILALRNLDEISLYHVERKCHHPLEIYSFTFNDVIDKTIILVEHLNELSVILPHIGNKNKNWEKKLEYIADNWLDSIIQHIDSCKGVLACFFSVDEEKQKDKCIKSFSKQINEYRKEVSTIVNLIKHNQRFLRIVYFHWIGGFVPGFFVEGIVDDGVMGPEPLVHKNSNTAISFNRSVLVQFCNIFSISSILTQSIYKITKRNPLGGEKFSYKNKELMQLLKLLSLSPVIFFPDEVFKPVPFIRCNVKPNNTVRILFEMPSTKIKPTTVPKNSHVGLSFRIGEVSLAYKLPYFENSARRLG
jgi:hypothetical protein